MHVLRIDSVLVCGCSDYWSTAATAFDIGLLRILLDLWLLRPLLLGCEWLFRILVCDYFGLRVSESVLICLSTVVLGVKVGVVNYLGC